jgi:6-phosphogluconolactonase (cycloisomerase 2 family)
MEINQRMSKRFGWLLGVVVLVSIGLLVACGSKYNASSDGLILVGSQGSGLIETFSFNLGSGSVSAISNSPANTSAQTCVLNGIPSSLVVDPKGTYAYAIINANPSCDTSTFKSTTGILAFKVNSSGTMSAAGKLQTLTMTSPTVIVAVDECGKPVPVREAVTVTQPVSPAAMTIDSAGKYLFVAEVSTSTTAPVTYTCPGQQPTTVIVNVPVPGTVSALSIGGGGNLSEVTGSPFAVPVSSNTPSLVALAATPTVFPAVGINGVQNSPCSAPGLPPPTSEYLYAVDSVNYVVWEFAVNTSTGVLGIPNPTVLTAVPSFATDPVPAGIAVDPCDRFVYVSDSLTDKVSAYTICSAVSLPQCQAADGSLVQVSGSPFALAGSANTPGPIAVDPYGNYVYVLGTLSNTVSVLKISPVSGSVASSGTGTTTVATGLRPTSITIRGDDNWLFVTNFNSASVSQYAITPSSGELTGQQAIQTDNYPWGVAVK